MIMMMNDEKEAPVNGNDLLGLGLCVEWDVKLY